MTVDIEDSTKKSGGTAVSEVLLSCEWCYCCVSGVTVVSVVLLLC